MERKEFPAQLNNQNRAIENPQQQSPIDQIVGGFKALFNKYTKGQTEKETIPDATDEQDCINKANYIGRKIDEHGQFRSEEELVKFLTELFQTLKMRRLGTNDEDRVSQTTAINIKVDGNEVIDNSFTKIIIINSQEYTLHSSLGKLHKHLGTSLSLFTYDKNNQYREIMNYSLETNLADKNEIARQRAEEELKKIQNSTASASAARAGMERKTREQLTTNKFKEFRLELGKLTRDQLSTDPGENLDQILAIAAKHELDEYHRLQDAQLIDMNEFIDTPSRRQTRQFKFDVKSNPDHLKLGFYNLKFEIGKGKTYGIQYSATLYSNGSSLPLYSFT